jgi:hypothetical protein
MRFRRVNDGRKDEMRLACDQTVVEPQDSKSLFGQPSVSLRVMIDLVLVPVAIRFNDYAMPQTDEIHDK